MSARVRLGGGERLVFVGHEVAIAVPNDEGDAELLYFREDWRQCAEPSAEIVDGEAAFFNSSGGHYAWVSIREPRCPSERKRAERLFARDFRDNLRVRS
jgi:hypothetical protein